MILVKPQTGAIQAFVPIADNNLLAHVTRYVVVHNRALLARRRGRNRRCLRDDGNNGGARRGVLRGRGADSAEPVDPHLVGVVLVEGLVDHDAIRTLTQNDRSTSSLFCDLEERTRS
jgi:hypothetical protein